MNSYNDNLHSTVVASLQTQQLQNKQLNSQRIAAMFTLYHAEGATITAEEKLEVDNDDLVKKTVVQSQAVGTSNISINLLASATQAGTYVKQSVTNTAVTAANVQVAGNAILKLASDMGSVYSIVNAADFDTDIYNLAKEARDLINNTAYLAEVASQLAMEASILTSEVSASTVLDKSKTANGLMGNLLQIVSGDFNTASQLVAADTANVASTSITEQAAEGDFEDIVAEYKASRLSYAATNDELNLGLVVMPAPMDDNPTASDVALNVTTRSIQFDVITSPFAHTRAIIPAIDPITTGRPVLPLTTDDYPVATYYVMLVKESKQTTFSITDAENIVLKGAGNFLQLNVSPPSLSTATPPVFVPSVITFVDGTATGTTLPVVNGQVSLLVNFFNVNGAVFKDSDEKPVALGTKYVVFLMAVYDSAYKKKLNTFDDYLSAPSPSFKMANTLMPAFGVTTGPAPAPVGESAPVVNEPFAVQFSVSENPAYVEDVEYRCLLLPGDGLVTAGLLTRASLFDLEDEVTQLQSIADTYDPLIATYNASLDAKSLKFEQIGFTPTLLPTSGTSALSTTSSNAKKGKSTPGASASGGTAQPTTPATTYEEQQQFNAEYTTAYNLLASARADKAKALAEIQQTTSGKFSFLINLRLAEQVSTGNYLLPDGAPTASADTAKGALYPIFNYVASFGPETTDNFGNPLVVGGTYSMVVLSICTVEEQNLPKYINSWTGGNDQPLVQFVLTSDTEITPVTPVTTNAK